MTWFSRAKDRLTPNSQPLGFYVNLPTLPRFVVLLFVILPLLFGFWYLWAQLLGLWMSNVDSIVEPVNTQTHVRVTAAPAFNLTTTLATLATTVTEKQTTSASAPTTIQQSPTTRQVTTTQEVTTPKAPETTTFVSHLIGDLARWKKQVENDTEPFKTCSSNNFECSAMPWNNKTRRLSWNRVCDGYEDCWNGEDERNCTTCLTSFSCPHIDGVHLNCLRGEKLCNGHADCLDATDETTYCNRECRDDEVACIKYLQYVEGEHIKTCVPKKFICAGEEMCHIYRYRIEAEKLECPVCLGNARACIAPGSGEQKCVSVYDMCDGDTDCADHRDEQFFHCDGSTTNGTECPGSCSLDKNETKYHSFVTQRFKNWMSTIVGSSRNIHCSDGWYSPLYACDGNHTQCDGLCSGCTPQAFYCYAEKKCIPKDNVCNGKHECADGSDEADCMERPRCGASANRCNGYCDCTDCSDEKNCTECKLSANDREYYYYSWQRNYNSEHKNKMAEENKKWIDKMYEAFPCKADNKCLSIQQRCDGREDCSDGTDEENCSCSECLMHPYRMYVCQEGNRCFRYDEVCDENFGSKCPNATRLDEEHCGLLRPDIESVLLSS